MNKILGLGVAALAIPAAIASAALIHPAASVAAPAGLNTLDVRGETYAKARAILKSQGVTPVFGGSVGSDLPQVQCIVNQQKQISSSKMSLLLDCSQKALDNATDSQPARPVAVQPSGEAPAPSAGQGTYGGPIGVPTAVGPQPGM